MDVSHSSEANIASGKHSSHLAIFSQRERNKEPKQYYFKHERERQRSKNYNLLRGLDSDDDRGSISSRPRSRSPIQNEISKIDWFDDPGGSF